MTQPNRSTMEEDEDPGRSYGRGCFGMKRFPVVLPRELEDEDADVFFTERALS